MESIDLPAKYRQQFTKDEFLRDVLFGLSLNESTPVDILTSSFSEIEEKETEFVAVVADVNISYTCMVGKDRTEEYWDKEKYTENGITKYRDVKKTRTVTDWHPFGGTNQSKETAFARNCDKDVESLVEDQNIFKVIRNSSEEYLEDCKDYEIEINPKAVSAAESLCKSKCFNRVILPGDRQKDKRFSGTADVEKTSWLILPEFTLNYSYNGNKYNANGFGCGALSTQIKTPYDTFDIKKTVKKKAFPILISAIAMVVAVFLVEIICLACDASALWIWIPVVAAAGLFGFYFFYKKKYDKQLRSDRRRQKMNALEETLSKKGLAPLTEKEHSLFIK